MKNNKASLRTVRIVTTEGVSVVQGKVVDGEFYQTAFVEFIPHAAAGK